jgi:hypothetical protein
MKKIVEIKTEDDALIFIENGGSLADVPEGLRAEKVCRTAVQNNGAALYLVPEKLKTAELCRAAVQNFGEALHYVPEKLKTAELCLTAVQNYGEALERPGCLRRFASPEKGTAKR